MEKLEKRLETYKEKYGDKKRITKFNYNQSAEQIIYRNEALRSSNRKLYADYVNNHPKFDSEKELKVFDSLTQRIIKLDRASFIAWVMEKGIVLVESDIYIFDEDSILKGIRVEDVEGEMYKIEATWDELFHNLHLPEELAKDRAYFWVLDE